jgi:hypothetical protein
VFPSLGSFLAPEKMAAPPSRAPTPAKIAPLAELPPAVAAAAAPGMHFRKGAMPCFSLGTVEGLCRSFVEVELQLRFRTSP